MERERILKALLPLIVFAWLMPVRSMAIDSSWGTASVNVGDTKTLYMSDAFVSILGLSVNHVISYQWSSYNTSVAQVTSQSLYQCTVRGVSTGSVRINCHLYYKTDGVYVDQYNSVDGYITLTVNQGIIKVTSVTVSPTSVSLKVKEEKQLTAEVLPSNATNKTVTWSSSPSGIATVTSSGKVTAVAAGTATITCKANDGSGKQGTCTVKVEAADPIKVTGISLNNSSLSLVKDDTRQLRATVTPSNATDKTVKWTSSNSSIASVSNDGLVTAIGRGSATITCKANDGSGVQATCDVTVSSVNPWSTFTAKTIEGVEMKFYSRNDGTCYVYGYSSSPAIDVNTTGPITIPSEAEGLKVTSINNSSFYDCKGITKVTVPNTVETIGGSAFRGCTALESVALGNGLKKLESSAFYNCTSLTSVTGINQLEYIGSSAFENTPWYNSLPNGLIYLGKVLYEYKGTMPDNTTISVKDGVKMISQSAFSSCKGLVGISIPQSIETIGSHPFSYCSNLTSITVASGNAKYDSRNNCNAIIEKEKNILIAGCKNSTIPSTVTAIGHDAFYGSGLTEIIIPNNIDSIANWAFENCSELKTVGIGKGVRVLGDCIFLGCSALQSITVVSSNPYYDSRDNCNAIIEKSTDKLIVGCTTTVIPQSVKAIGNFAFKTSDYDTYSITLSDQVETIGEYAFAYMSKTRALTIGKGVKEIGKSAFNGCNALRSIHVLSQDPVEIDETVFKNNYTNFPDSIYNNATLYVPIGARINYMTTPCWNKFKHIVETDGLTPCEGDILELAGSPLIFAVTSTSEKTSEVIGVKSSAEGRISIPSQTNDYSVRGLGYDAFYNKKGITHIDIPVSVTYLDDYALYYCSDLESVELPSSLERIGYFALGGLGKINSIVIPKSVKDIDRGIFTADSLLMSVTVESGNSVYDSRGGCNAVIETATNTLVAGIQSTVIPNDIKTIGYFAFNSQKMMETMSIPNGVTCIDNYAFNNCSLKSITIPASVDSIGSWAFRYCRNLETVTSLIEDPTAINENVFYSNYVNSEWQFTSATLYVPKGTKEKYAATPGWNKFKNIIETDSTNPIIKGDVNEDGYVNGTDLVALTNIILGKNPQKPAADVNGDGNVNGTDYVVLANIILGKSNARRMIDIGEGQTTGNAVLNVEPFAISAGETKELSISLTNPNDVLTLLQFDLQLPKGLSIAKNGNDYQTDMSVRTNRSSHQLSVYGNGHHARFLLSSSSNDLIEGTEGALIRLTVTADADFNGGAIALYDILGVSPNEQEVYMPDCQFSLVGGTTGIYCINGNHDTPEIYSLSGQRQSAMKKGLNIVEGKKVIIK